MVETIGLTTEMLLMTLDLAKKPVFTDEEIATEAKRMEYEEAKEKEEKEESSS